jgi:hypothetical protein
MSGKPVHAGHWGLIEIASRENDEVHLFVSSSDRKRPGEMVISGEAMMQVWQEYLEPALPGNVAVTYGGAPVGHVYKELEAAEAEESEDSFQIYSDVEDILKYTDDVLKKYAPSLFENGQIERRGVKRTETVPVSGTKMREFLEAGKVKQFSQMLPPPVQGNAAEIIDLLRGSTKAESLLRRYVRELLT